MLRLYKIRHVLSVLLFVVTYIVSSFLIPESCADGWSSSSIGRRGACSHHGGVDQTPISFILSLSAAIVLYSALDQRFRTFAIYIVPSNFPMHPEEESLKNPLVFKPVFRVPLHSAISRKNWPCESCKNAMASGSQYHYYTEGYGAETERIRLCELCVSELPEINRKNQDTNIDLRRQRKEALARVESYYKNAS